MSNIFCIFADDIERTMISNTFHKYIWLLRQFLRYKVLTYEEVSANYRQDGLAQEGLPLRTFHQYRKGVEELFGVRIVCENGGGYHYHAEGVEALDTVPNQWLVSTYGLVDEITQAHLLKDRILPEDIPGGTAYLQPIIEAMKENKVLKIDYQPFEGSNTTYRLQPYCLRLYRRRWYVLGKIEGELRHLCLDRMIDLAVTDEKFELPKDFDAKQYYANSVGIYVNEALEPQKVRLRVYGTTREYLRKLPLHRSQKEVLVTQEYSEFQYWVCCTPELTTDILSLGENVEVLEPQKLREEVKEKLNASLERYQ